MRRYVCRCIFSERFFLVILITLFVTCRSSNHEKDEDCNGNKLYAKQLKEIEGQDALYQDDPFKSYLNWPRFHFNGQFQADTSTVNNDLRNYNVTNFTAWNLLPMPDGNGQWNPNGTGSFRLMGGLVTRACYVNGLCLAERDVDPIIGSKLKEGGRSVSAKMVDLDPQSMDTSTIYGWRISIGPFFTADFHPAPFTYLWPKMYAEPSMEGDETLGASYQSALTNITWLKEADTSSLIRQLRRSMKACKSKSLSIRFHLDMFNPQSTSEQFLWGRIAGTIGVLGLRAPLTASSGRLLESVSQIVRDAPFVLDHQHGKVHVDFGNSLPVTLNGSFSVKYLGSLAVGFSRNESPGCSSDFVWLGIVPYRRADWYETAGLHSFPRFGPMTTEQLQQVARSPLVMAEVRGTWPSISCKRILLREPADGLLIRPQGDWVFRRDANEPVHFDLFVTKFGKALTSAPVIIGTPSRFLRNLTKSLEKEPELDVPPLRLPDAPIRTNRCGIASVSIQTRDPGNPRVIIDGQLYRISYNLPFHPPKKEYVIRILVWDSYQYHSPPNWMENVRPVFKLYANLFPIMTREFIHLGDFNKVVENKKLIKMAMSLSLEHPNHMPVTRDLSKAKRRMIIEWLSQEQPLFQRQNAVPDESAANTPSKIALYFGRKVHSRELQIKTSNPSTHSRKRDLRSDLENNAKSHSTQAERPEYLRQADSRGSILTSNAIKDSAFSVKQFSFSNFTTNLIQPRKKKMHKYPKRKKSKDRTMLKSKVHFQSNEVLARYFSLEQLKADLQTALELEHATIPPYLTALASIKQDHNKQVKRVLKTVLVQEMLHMALVSNVLNAVGGTPSLTHRGFVLDYPSFLPGGVHRDLIVPLEKFSKSLIKGVFMKIEEPTLTVRALEDRRLIIEDLEGRLEAKVKQLHQKSRSGFHEDIHKRSKEQDDVPLEKEAKRFRCLSYESFIPNLQTFNIVEKKKKKIFTRHKNTIGTFYNYILKALGYLTNCGKNNSIFVGHQARQLTQEQWYAGEEYGHGKVIKVIDYFSAVAAIREIVEEGEGSSPCMPAAASLEMADLSHYFAFYSLYMGRVVSLRKWIGTGLPTGVSHEELMWWKVCKSMYKFDGSEVAFDPKGVWPMLSNPRMSNYVPWSKPYLLSHMFNTEYSKLLSSLEHAFNGYPGDIRDAMGLMYSIHLHAKKLVRMPVSQHGNPDVGPNAGPTFEILRD